MPKLNPLLESDNIECAHKGKVLLQSSTKDLMCVQDSSGTDAGVISLQDLANVVIIGCTNNIAGIPNPCTKLVSIPNSICSTLLEINNQKIVKANSPHIMQNYGFAYNEQVELYTKGLPINGWYNVYFIDKNKQKIEGYIHKTQLSWGF